MFVRIYLTSQKKNSMHERALKITYNGKSAFKELCHKENSVSFFIFFKQICFNASKEFVNFGDRNVI